MSGLKEQSNNVKNIVTVIGFSNIALVKYWGKRDKDLILPYNSSLSITFSGDFKTETSIAVIEGHGEDIFYINGVKQDVSNKDIKEQLDALKYLKVLKEENPKIKNTHLIINSKNYFPTSAGLASSASGISALIYGINSAYNLNLEPKELSIIARRASGSSSRSIFGGYVIWYKGKLNDGSDSYSESIFPHDHIKDLIIISTVIDSRKKKVSSRGGMAQTVETSELFKSRIKSAEKHIEELKKALKEKNLIKLYEITMKESDQLHAVTLDTYPPIMYLNDTSKEVMNMIIELNREKGKEIAAYTFDAGPNPFIITTKEYENMIIENLKSIEGINKENIHVLTPGEGPRVLTEEESKKSKTRMELEKLLGNQG